MAETTPLLLEKIDIPMATFTNAIDTPQGRKPQAIAHRGYKAAYPENTMGAFRGAVEVGAHAIETDIHLSKDGVVVLSHDATLKRCFGIDRNIVDCDWGYLETLRTLKEPQERMPRLKDLLEYLAKPGLGEIWVLLDIKLDNDDDVFRLMSATLEEAKPSKAWNQRILLGIWHEKHLPFCTEFLHGFPIAYIGFSILYARQFLKVPKVNFNMLQKIMVGPFGSAFLRDIKKARRSIFLWTVNEESWMKWSIRKEVDGVITDDPKKFLEVCDSYQGEEVHFPFSAWIVIFLMNIAALVAGFIVRWRFSYKIKDATAAKRIGSLGLRAPE
ncbi:putative glycerophosphoryl diester phosphodiesterase [Amylocarpus encephaloides]|uniref:Glycerophosphoryl diester phosphodiesterase n=1 Tax=Amylocarpus encephaloides TaxID=45428 RepID=A0A9P7YM57_9HELO|nr:putative glycerophosphoryl diester phosphodiesterase [Amylocarpus encephaloides]